MLRRLLLPSHDLHETFSSRKKKSFQLSEPFELVKRGSHSASATDRGPRERLNGASWFHMVYSYALLRETYLLSMYNLLSCLYIYLYMLPPAKPGFSQATAL